MTPRKLRITLLIFALFLWSSFQLFYFTSADIHASVGRQKLAASCYQAADAHLVKATQCAQFNASYYYTHAEIMRTLATQAKFADSVVENTLLARDSFERAIELNPLEGSHWLGLAHVDWWLSHFEEHKQKSKLVEHFLLRALATALNNGKYLYAIVAYYLSTGKVSKSFPYVKRLAMVYPDAYQKLKRHPHRSPELKTFFIQG